jgi:hypothetical protein
MHDCREPEGRYLAAAMKCAAQRKPFQGETVSAAKHAEAVAALKKAEMVELQASLAYRLALAELDRIRGVLASSRRYRQDTLNVSAIAHAPSGNCGLDCRKSRATREGHDDNANGIDEI